jgi:hypothetical protein
MQWLKFGIAKMRRRTPAPNNAAPGRISTARCFKKNF